jgi:transglutaminase-like putative cysteine protease
MMGGYLPLNESANDSRSKSFRVEWEETGLLNKTTKHSANIDYIENITILRVNNAPAFKTEPFMNSPLNYLSKIEHEIVNFRMPYGPSTDYSSTWPKLSKQLMESNSFGKLLNRSNFLSDEVSKIMETHSDPADRMVAAFSLIQQEMTWNNRNGIYATQNLRKVWDDKQGNAADINLLLVVLLRELEIYAEPVILSTRSHGIVNPT